MNHHFVFTFVPSLMTVIALLIVTALPASANCATVNQIRDRQELADYHGGSQSFGACTGTLTGNPHDQINSRAELAEYQAAVASQTYFVNETNTVAEDKPFDQIADRAELAAYQASITIPSIPHSEEYTMTAMK